ncbi:MAG: saccharopine dehydrogenase NADP-binding domain-containing protein [Gemmatimonadaceae bacterium]|nr:saccharopine dehydrogenase NADP-binding domain-containing protein [Gemmatimonadaceae bacterium]
MRMLVLGAGLQGSACAFDLVQQPAVSEVILADQSIDHLPPFLTPFLGGKLRAVALDAKDGAAVAALMQGVKAVMCALPYYFNKPMTEAAIAAGAHFCDLGGNTEIVGEQRTLDAKAKAAGVTVIPDCGLAPGMVNILGQMGIDRCDSVDTVRFYVGGLPQHPTGPLKYQIAYSMEGVLDYYTTLSWIVRDGKRTRIKALSEVEAVSFAELGALEAFHTAGGLSTMGFRYEGKIPSMEYKTLRYPGHAQIVEAMRDLGLFELTPVTVNGVSVAPRAVAIATMGPKLNLKQPDLVALRVVVTGKKAGKPVTHTWELVDRMDEARRLSAMMRTTGFSLAITGYLQATGQMPAAGVHTPDECVPGDAYVAELAKRGIDIRYTLS